MVAIKKVLAWCLWFASVAFAQTPTPELVIEFEGGRIEVLGQHYAGLTQIGKKQSRLVFYRQADSGMDGATSVFVNGSYHASLIKGAYTALCYSPGPAELGARQTKVGQGARDVLDSITELLLLGGQTYFLKVREEAGRPVFQSVDAAQAVKELPAERLQQHTISRVAQDCIEVLSAQPPESWPVPVTVPEPAGHYTQIAASLFRFARSDLQAMTQEGMAAVELLVSRLRTQYSHIQRLHLVGHADPLGDAQINERLALERARTVQRYLESSAHLNGVQITVEGQGARAPLVADCGHAATPQAQACNQPNRRVVIEVTGVRR